MENGYLEIEKIECNIRIGKRNYENVIMLFFSLSFDGKFEVNDALNSLPNNVNPHSLLCLYLAM